MNAAQIIFRLQQYDPNTEVFFETIDEVEGSGTWASIDNVTDTTNSLDVPIIVLS